MKILKQLLVCVVSVMFVNAVPTNASSNTVPSTSSEPRSDISQSTSSIARCLSRDDKWNNSCSLRVSRRSTDRRVNRTLETARHHINDNIKSYLRQYYRFNPITQIPAIFNRTFDSNAGREGLQLALYGFIANVDVLSNCGIGSFTNQAVKTRIAGSLQELKNIIYRALCTLSTSGPLATPPEAESMVYPIVVSLTTTDNELAQAINVYVTLSDIEAVLRIIGQRYF